MSRCVSRREFLGAGAVGLLSVKGLPSPEAFAASAPRSELPFKISLAEWSLNQSLFGRTDLKITNLDFPRIARRLGIEGLEYVNQFFMDKARDQSYLAELNQRVKDNDCKSVLIMCDNEGAIGAADKTRRLETIENHIKWLEAAKTLGCHSIRFNAQSEGSYEEQQKLAADGLRGLCERAVPYGLNVIVENHGGLSSNGEWLVGVIKLVNLPNCGTLPDFGNFGEYDRYKGVAEMMPYAKGVSAKATRFDDEATSWIRTFPHD
jgi:sugar phosphate isomerase/epimerase